MQFGALPQGPVILIFNDADEEFPAKSSVLFEGRAKEYLVPEKGHNNYPPPEFKREMMAPEYEVKKNLTKEVF